MRTTLDGSEGVFEPLTERELEVLRLVAAGTSNREIAVRLTVTAIASSVYGELHSE